MTAVVFRHSPFQGFSNAIASFPGSAARETSAFAATRINWKETSGAHIFKTYVPRLKKEKVKVEAKEGRGYCRSSSREARNRRRRWTRGTRWRGATAVPTARE
nr:17.8 kDa class I heat shock protein-like [Ipomoea batatas]